MTNNADFPVAMSATISESETPKPTAILRKYAQDNAETFRSIAAMGHAFVNHMESIGVMRVPNEMLSEAAPLVVTDALIQNILEPVMRVERLAVELEEQFYKALNIMLTLAEMQEVRNA